MRYLFPVFAVFALAAAGATAQDRTDKGRIAKRTYFFEAAKKDMEYALFVPDGYEKSKKTPLVVVLHGLGSNPRQVIRYRGITDEANERGYIVVAPYGYNSRGWYGSRGKGKKGPYFGNAGDPENLGELSETDVMNVLGIVREELNIDADRIYLMGHSMGGGGTVYLGATYPDIWAALAPLAPALHGSKRILEKMKHIPVMVVAGDRDRLVRVETVRPWVARMEKLGMTTVYKEIEGGNHISTFTRNPEMIAELFDFFDRHERGKPAPKEPAKEKAKESAKEKVGAGK